MRQKESVRTAVSAPASPSVMFAVNVPWMVYVPIAPDGPLEPTTEVSVAVQEPCVVWGLRGSRCSRTSRTRPRVLPSRRA
jgi:hypothetical protein